ncbi:MAG: ATP-binding cassette domain-containing protein, partial [Clostridiales bacterium]|nr:ATP-binding cassette domain-containing protein [Clostridiales bacterium]
MKKAKQEKVNSTVAPSEHLIEFKNVCKIYKLGEVEIPALNGVDFTVERGEFVVVLGASGAGKSTVLNILGGMDTATSGNVYVDGEDITEYKQKRLTLYRREKVGFVFQFY